MLAGAQTSIDRPDDDITILSQIFWWYQDNKFCQWLKPYISIWQSEKSQLQAMNGKMISTTAEWSNACKQSLVQQTSVVDSPSLIAFARVSLFNTAYSYRDSAILQQCNSSHPVSCDAGYCRHPGSRSRLRSKCYTVSQKMHKLWNGIAHNYRARFWWHSAEIFKIL